MTTIWGSVTKYTQALHSYCTCQEVLSDTIAYGIHANFRHVKLWTYLHISRTESSWASWGRKIRNMIHLSSVPHLFISLLQLHSSFSPDQLLLLLRAHVQSIVRRFSCFPFIDPPTLTIVLLSNSKFSGLTDWLNCVNWPLLSNHLCESGLGISSQYTDMYFENAFFFPVWNSARYNILENKCASCLLFLPHSCIVDSKNRHSLNFCIN